MKTKNILAKIALALLALILNPGFAFSTPLDELKKNVKTGNGPGRLENLSGIELVSVKHNGTFQLQFNNDIKENGIIEMSNAAGNTVFSKPIAKAINPDTNTMNVGRLNSGVYLIEVKTGNTIYWKKVRIRK